MTTFNRSKFDATKEPMFFGQPVNVARYDQQKYPLFEKLTEKQLSFFWRPEEIDLSRDRQQYEALPDNEKHIFISNLKYQTLLDSVQGRSPNLALLPIVSIPELETWIESWSFFETIHSRSYTHILRNILNDPSPVFDSIIDTPEIVARAGSVTEYYDKLIRLCKNDAPISLRKRALYLCLMSVNILEAVRFYVSFACSFAFAERAIMEGNAKVIKLIARDEAVHLAGTQAMINLLASGADDPDMRDIAADCRDECIQMFIDAAQQEKDWAKYLFRDGSMIGLNAAILSEYVEYITNVRMRAVGLPVAFQDRKNPLPWMNAWLVSDNVQVAPQESEISSYLVGQVDTAVSDGDFDEFEF
jgi:ribonucleoside-diphosphate reductase beta chain